MLSRYHLSIEKYPRYNESVILKTWPSKHEGVFTLREYTMERPDGEILARMTSSFVIYDIKSKKIVNVEEHLFFEDSLISERAIDDDFPSLKLPKKVDHSQKILSRKHDIDFNRHVTNRALVEMAIESVPMETLETHKLKDAQITFKGQAFYGDILESQCDVIARKNSYKIIHHLINKKNGDSILKMETKWLRE
jgi:medium-chain acyl-[acyl-carrier-protein] hydrolase